MVRVGLDFFLLFFKEKKRRGMLGRGLEGRKGRTSMLAPV